MSPLDTLPQFFGSNIIYYAIPFLCIMAIAWGVIKKVTGPGVSYDALDRPSTKHNVPINHIEYCSCDECKSEDKPKTRSEDKPGKRTFDKHSMGEKTHD